jgi:hypothetical protein
MTQVLHCPYGRGTDIVRRGTTPIDTAMPLDHGDVAEVIRQAMALSR